MTLMWSLVAACLGLLWEGAGAQNFNPLPLNQRRREPPAVVMPRNFNPTTVQQAFARADQIIADRSGIRGRRNGTAAAAGGRPMTSVASTRHQMFLAGRARSRGLERTQESFEEATRVLLRDFNLSPDQIMFGAADSDLKTMLGRSRTRVDGCEAEFNTNCNPRDRYRTFDATCNNLRNPTWGMAASCFMRLLDPAYSDGIANKRMASSGRDLPVPRVLSQEIHAHMDSPTDYVTHMFMAFGQFLDHDISQAPLSQGENNQLLECCPVRGDDPLQCDPLLIPNDDPFFRQFGITCLNNVRSAMCATCALGPRQQTNQVTGYIDTSHIYGLNLNQSRALRTLDGSGLLRFQTSPLAGELLPSSAIPANDFCSFQDTRRDCFETGDQRANQHPALTSLHTVFLREHNRIARRLREVNRNWDDERLFQEARRILAASMQMITYSEVLPLIIGPERMEWFDLSVRRSGYTQYDDTVQATLVNEFSTAAFRFGHSMINSFFPEVNRGQAAAGNRLRDIFQFPFEIYDGQLERMVSGLSQSSSQKFDRYIVRDVTNHLYQVRGNESGLDLASLNINRGRDHGIPGYTKLVEYCGGPQITNFRQLDRLFQRNVRPLFQRLYESVEDIDLFSGGLAERPNQGAVIGPTFTCIIGIQFYHLKYGDRFYFEHGGQTGSFTPEQIREIRKVTLAKLICDNSRIQQIQPNVMLYPSNRNAVQNCNELPALDLSLWRG